MAFEQLEIECNAKKINGYPISTTKTPNTIPVAGLNGDNSNVLSILLNENFFGLSSTNIADLPADLINYANYNIKYYNVDTSEWRMYKPDLYSFNTNGYATINISDNRLLLQWGYSSGTFEGSYSVTFPVAFSVAPYAILCAYKWGTAWNTTAGVLGQIITSSMTSTGFSWYCQSVEQRPTVGGIYWLAIGYVS